MIVSEARIAANRANALKSTGPKTPEGKLASRANALTHGLTGAGVVIAESDAAEVDRKAAAFGAELQAPGEVGRTLARRLAILAVRMDRAADQELAAIDAHVRRALEEFEAPEGVDDPAEIDRLRARAGQIARFDPSPEATLARKYEAAAERNFFRALKELRQLRADARQADEPAVDRTPAAPEAAAVAASARATLAAVASYFPDAPKAPAPPNPAVPAPPTARPARFEPAGGAFDVPITIGRSR